MAEIGHFQNFNRLSTVNSLFPLFPIFFFQALEIIAGVRLSASFMKPSSGPGPTSSRFSRNLDFQLMKKEQEKQCLRDYQARRERRISQLAAFAADAKEKEEEEEEDEEEYDLLHRAEEINGPERTNTKQVCPMTTPSSNI